MTEIAQPLQEKITKIRDVYAELGISSDKIINELRRCNAVDRIIRNNPILSRWGLSLEELYKLMQEKTIAQFGAFLGSQEDFRKVYVLSLSVPIEAYVATEHQMAINSKAAALTSIQNDQLRQCFIAGQLSPYNKIGDWATVRSGKAFVPDDKVHDGVIVVEPHNLATYGLLFDCTVIADFEENRDEPYIIQKGDLLISTKHPWTMTVVTKIDGMVMVAGKDVLIVRIQADYTGEFMKVVLDSEAGQRMIHAFCPLCTSEITPAMVEAFYLPEVNSAVRQRITQQYRQAADSCHNKILTARRLLEDEEAELASFYACSEGNCVIE